MYLYLKCFKLNFFLENIFMIYWSKEWAMFMPSSSVQSLCECQPATMNTVSFKAIKMVFPQCLKWGLQSRLGMFIDTQFWMSYLQVGVSGSKKSLTKAVTRALPSYCIALGSFVLKEKWLHMNILLVLPDKIEIEFCLYRKENWVWGGRSCSIGVV